jgi:hypothetical protein
MLFICQSRKFQKKPGGATICDIPRGAGPPDPMKSGIARTVSTSGRLCELPRFGGSYARITGGNQRKRSSSEWARETLKRGEKRLERYITEGSYAMPERRIKQRRMCQ